MIGMKQTTCIRREPGKADAIEPFVVSLSSSPTRDSTLQSSRVIDNILYLDTFHNNTIRIYLLNNRTTHL